MDRAAERGPARGNPCYIIKGDRRFVDVYKRQLYGIWGARISLKRCMAASCLLCVAGYAAAVFAPWPLLSLAGCALCGFSVGILWPGTFSLSMVHCPEGGTAMFALFALAGDVGCALGPGVVGAVSGMAGGALKAGLLAACAFPVLLLLAVSRLRRRPKGEQ